MLITALDVQVSDTTEVSRSTKAGNHKIQTLNFYMFRNYLKVALRYLSKHKDYTVINVLGLSVGIACCILIMLFVKSEWSFDRFHTKSDRIYRAWLEEHYQGEYFRNTVTPIPLGPVLQAGVPDVEATCRTTSLTPMVTYKNNTFIESVGMVDSSFFNLFDFEFTTGNKSSALAGSNSIVVTEAMAKKYFGTETAIGKNLELQLGDTKILFTVSSVLK